MINASDIDSRIAAFKCELASMTPLHAVRKHIIGGSCAMITESSYFELRQEVSEKFQVHTNEVLVVGSSKLGFSIAPTKRYRHFSERSDIDLVVVSETLFNTAWRSVHQFWLNGGYWENAGEFKKYLFRGWIRPDKLPNEASFGFAMDWWEFFNGLTSTGRFSAYKIAGALYKDWYFLESYQLKGVIECANELHNGGSSNED
jgi:hypothetical protein